MNILQLINRRQRRGAEVFAARLGEYLLREGQEVVLAGLYAAPEQSLRLPRATEADLSQEEPSLLPSTRIMKSIARCLDDFDVELVQANAGDTLKHAVLSRRIYGWEAPIIYRNASLMSHWARGWFRKRFNRWLLNQTEAIASVSRQSRRDIEEEMNIRHIPLEYIPNGVECSQKESRARLPLDIPDDAVVLLHIGSFTEEKRHRLLLKYFDEIVNDAVFPVHLILVGDGPLWSSVQRKAAEHPQARKITLTGSVEEVRPYYDRSNLMLMTSSIEGVPGVVLEAAAREIPTIAFGVGGLSECIKHGETGLLIEEGDDESFLRGCLRLIEDDPLRNKYGAAAREYVCSHYDIQEVVREFQQLYRRVLEQNASP